MSAGDPTAAFDDPDGGGGSTTADQEEDSDPFGGGFELEDDDTITSDGEAVEPADDTRDRDRDDDDDDDRTRFPGDPVDSDRDVGGETTEEAREQVGTGPEDREPDTPPETTEKPQPPDPTDPASPAGEAVTGTEARRVAEGEIDVDNLGDRPALVSALSRRGFPDIRGAGISRGLDRAIDRGLVSVGIESGRLQTELTEEGRRVQVQTQEIEQARIAQEEGETAVSIRDLSAERRAEIGQQFESQLEEQLGFDVDPGRDFTLRIDERTEEGVVVGAEFTDTFRQRRRGRIGEEAEADIEAAVGRSRLSRLGFGDEFVAPAGTAGTIEGGRRATPELARQFVDLELGEDFTVDIEQMGDGFAVRAGLTESFEERETRQAAATQIERQTGMPVDPQQDIELEDEGQPQLTEGAQEELEALLTGDEFEREVRDVPVPSVAAPFIGSGERQEPGPIPGFTRVPLGTLPGVSEEEATLEGVIGGTLDVVGEAADRQAEDFAFTRGVSPLAAGAIVGRPETLPAGRQIEQDVDSPAQEQAERFLEGGGALIGAPISIAGGLEELREFGLETVERAPRQPLPETAEFVGEEVVETGEQTLSELADLVGSPGGRAELAGSLAFSAGVFGAARAVGPRASFATRAAIQPGEEALGIGGFAATRRVAGRGAAERFFPRREPLIFSEEAVIMGARRFGGRARSELQRTRVDVGTRPGLGLGGLELEIERDPREITEADIAEPLGDPRPGRLREQGEPEPHSAFERRRQRRQRGIIEEEIERPPGEVERAIRREAQRNRQRLLEAESERGRELTDRRLESIVGAGPLQMEGLGFDQRSRAGIRGELESPVVETEIAIGLESESDLELASELEPELETEGETELEQELEFETEFELEQEAEVESEVEQEFEVEPLEFDLFGDEDGFSAPIEAFGGQRVTDFGTVAGAVGVDVPGGVSLDDETTEQILDGPASPSGFGPMPFEGDQMLDLGAPSVTGLEGPAAVPPGGQLPASVSNAIFDERDNRPLF